MRKRIFEIIEVAQENDRYSAIYDGFMMVLIVVSLVPLAFKTDHLALDVVDKGCAAIFVVDYLLRWITADYKFNHHSIKSFIIYPFSFMAIVDLLSILPSFAAVNGSLKVLRILRMIRALRVMRIFKAARYSRNVQIIMRVLQESKDALSAVCSLAVVYVLISALVIINVEPDSFNNFFDAVYWATVSLTTMGYGDIYPVSTIGRLFTMVSAVLGIAIVALPAGIITAGYMSALQEEKERKNRNNK